MKNANHYKVLGINQDASNREVKLAYRHAMKKTHPDMTQKDTSEQFSQVQEAYRVLSNPILRDSYDLELLYGNNIPDSVLRNHQEHPPVKDMPTVPVVNINDIMSNYTYRKESFIPHVIPTKAIVILLAFTGLLSVITASFAFGAGYKIGVWAGLGLLVLPALFGISGRPKQASDMLSTIGIAGFLAGAVALLQTERLVAPITFAMAALCFFGWSYVFDIHFIRIVSNYDTSDALSVKHSSHLVYENPLSKSHAALLRYDEVARDMYTLGEALETLLKIPGTRIVKNVRFPEDGGKSIFGHIVTQGNKIAFVTPERLVNEYPARYKDASSVYNGIMLPYTKRFYIVDDIEAKIREIAVFLSEDHKGTVNREMLPHVLKWRVL